MFSVVGWCLAVLLWAVKDVRQLPETRTYRTETGVEVEGPVPAEAIDNMPTYWLLRDGSMQLRTTDRQAVADWIRQHGSRDLKVLTTIETE